MSSIVDKLRHCRLFPYKKPNEENALSQAALCGVIEKILIAKLFMYSFESSITCHQVFGQV